MNVMHNMSTKKGEQFNALHVMCYMQRITHLWSFGTLFEVTSHRSLWTLVGIYSLFLCVPQVHFVTSHQGTNSFLHGPVQMNFHGSRNSWTTRKHRLYSIISPHSSVHRSTCRNWSPTKESDGGSPQSINSTCLASIWDRSFFMLC